MNSMSSMSSRDTDDIVADTNPTTTIPRPEPEATRLIDVHIYTLSADDEEDEEARSIETTLAQISQENQPLDNDDEDDEDQSAPTIQARPGRTVSPLVLVGIGILLLAILGQGYLALLPFLTPTTTITILPVSKHVQTMQALSIVAGPITNPDQIAGRVVSSLTISQNQTIPTTGKAHQDATAATGMITFYNVAPYAQTIPLGMLLVGKSGMHYTTTQEATIPAAVYPTLGQATVAARALTSGPGGNQPADDLYGPCCLLNISAVSSAFTGGQDARDYQTVSDQDVSGTANSLKTKLVESAQTVLQTQLQNGEALMTPLACQSHVTSDHQPGEEAVQVTITINETCTALAYKTATLHAIIAQAVNQQAAKLGAGYTATSTLDIHITQAHLTNQGTATMQVVGIQTYGYQFSQEEQQHLKERIAGTGKEQATAVLLHTPGVQSVSMHFDAGMTTIPTDTNHIHFLFLVE